jgi:adenine-specific DNA-methyltransferase
MNRKLFYKNLKELLTGTKAEGKNGIIDLIKAKTKYYEKLEKLIENDIEEALKKYPSFKNKLNLIYSFFSKHTAENGSIYSKDTYNDPILFIKTQPLYYIKTSKLFKSKLIEINGIKLFFDASTIEDNDSKKKTLSYKLKEIKEDKTVIFSVHYEKEPKTTNIKEIIEKLKAHSIYIEEEKLKKAFKKFEKEPELDFFLNEKVESFLKEQFNKYICQELLKNSNKLDQSEIAQIQTLKEITYKIIEFIASFEKEIIKIWNEPRQIKSINYIITLNKLEAFGEKGIEIIRKLLTHKNIEKQIEEWKELGIINDFDTKINPSENLPKEYKFLPIDTKYFKDLEKDILNLFDNLEDSLDGWLIKSESYQALNTLLPKFKGKVKTIYIDPPYNTGNNNFPYKDNYKHSSWLMMMKNRLNLAKELLQEDGIIFTSIGDLNPQEGESFRLQLLQSMIFPKRFGNLIWKKRNEIGSFSEKNLTENHEYITVFGNKKAFIYKNIITDKQKKEYKHEDEKGPYKWMSLLGPSQQTKEKRPNLNYGIIIDPNTYNIIGLEYNQNGKKKQELFSSKHTNIEIIYPKKNYTWLIGKDAFKKYHQQGLIKVFKEKNEYSVKIKKYLFKPDKTINGSILKSILTDNGINIGLNADATKELSDLFYPKNYSALKPKPTSLIKLLIQTTTKDNDIICDFFAGSGTTAHAVMKLNKEDSKRRKFILIETEDYFDSVIIPRIKKVAYSFNWKNGKPQDADGIGIFLTYLELEQFEEALNKITNTIKEPQ